MDDDDEGLGVDYTFSLQPDIKFAHIYDRLNSFLVAIGCSNKITQSLNNMVHT